MFPKLKWKPFTPPAPSDTPSAEVQLRPEASQKIRRPGRPKGSKNKRSTAPPASPPAARSPDLRVNSENNQPNAFNIAVPPVVSTLIHLTECQHPPPSRQLHSRVSRRLFHNSSQPQRTRLFPQLPHQHPRARASAPSARSTVDRARQLVDDTTAADITHPSTSPVSHAPGMMTDPDADNEHDPHSLVHDDGLGEEEDEPDSDEGKTWARRLRVHGTIQPDEKGEIRVCVFVATKSHSQFEDALRRLAEDLVVYGHNLPEVFYTDNMVDKAMLEKIFPSLTEAVIPIEKYSHLAPFETPDFVRSPAVLDEESMINNAMRAILDDVPATGHIVIGFDSEWNVDMTQYGRFGGRSPPAVVQVAYKESVFVMQIGEMLTRRSLLSIRQSPASFPVISPTSNSTPL
ncbi:hypothetical protein B0H10DRAFT_2243150 [Mycena sp. CBHHK59/15]|nr:hypothetical protein B0H10DRAFT_2243150 [Mycena sp. CBHHK59/15]